jgi:hypothetical protein
MAFAPTSEMWFKDKSIIPNVPERLMASEIIIAPKKKELI